VSKTPELADDFRDFIVCLNARRVNAVLVGGYAMGWHGVVRATGDIDFLYEQTSGNVDRLCSALQDFGAPDRFIDRAFLLSPDAITQIGLPPFRIDLLAAISGVSFASVRAGAEEVLVNGQKLVVIGLAELRANKAASGRPKDIQDLQQLNSSKAAMPRRSRSKTAKKGRRKR
jgi:hypothetical protein